MNSDETGQRPAWRWRIATAAMLVLFSLAALRMSWLGDDAFITFRCVDNLVAGRGPVWNVGERVQTFTHPAWFALLCVARAITGELAITAQILGLVVSAAAMVWLARSLDFGHAAAAAVLICICSRACHVYATSGLETPLAQLLLAALVAASATADPVARLRRTALACGLLGATRYDLLLLCGPSLCAALRGVDRRVAVRALAFGLSPLWAWILFAIVYYGTPFPITAYAKAFCHGVPAGDLVLQGLRYAWRSIATDPVTPTMLVAGIVAGLVRPGRRAMALGVLAYCAYVVKVGGDYMLGRFWVPPFFAAVAIVGHHLATVRPRLAGVVIAAACALTCAPGVPRVARWPWEPNPWYGQGAIDNVYDEQLRAQWDNGLLSPARIKTVSGEYGEQLRAEGLTTTLVTVWGWAGWAGYRAGPMVHQVDPWLCDPLIARLPVADPNRWFVGHFFRRVPAGYLETLARRENRISHPGLAQFYAALRSTIHDPVWSRDRWANMWALWTGRHDAGLADYVATEYRTPPRIEVPIAEIADPPPASGFWVEAPRARSAQAGGLAIVLPARTKVTAVRLHVTPGAYEISLRRDGAEVGHEKVLAGEKPERLALATIAIADSTGEIDRIWIDAVVPPDAPYTAVVGRVEVVR